MDWKNRSSIKSSRFTNRIKKVTITVITDNYTLTIIYRRISLSTHPLAQFREIASRAVSKTYKTYALSHENKKTAIPRNCELFFFTCDAYVLRQFTIYVFFIRFTISTFLWLLSLLLSMQSVINMSVVNIL